MYFEKVTMPYFRNCIIISVLRRIFNCNQTIQSVDEGGITGCDAADKLTEVLVSLTGISVGNQDTNCIIALYNNLSDYDKRLVVYKRQVNQIRKGRFGHIKRLITSHANTDVVRK